MPKFIGVKNGRIQIVSDNKFINQDLYILTLPTDIETVPSQELIINYRVKDGKVFHVKGTRKSDDIKLAFVANYGMQCGIASYSSFLHSELTKHIKNCKIFAEKYDNCPSNTDTLIHCWKRGETLSNLINEIKAYDPDVILIQHEWGLWHDSRQWLSMMSQLYNYRIIATMHSIFYHRDKSIVEASIPEIIVHLQSAKEVLEKAKGISSKIHVVPHGCFLPEQKEKIWNFYKSENTFMQFGFLFKYKGFENSIKATAILKEKYPNVYFTAICSHSQHAKLEHDNYHAELINLVNSLNLNENVGLISGYQSDYVLDTFLQMNKIAVFPYISNKGHECFGSSGAVPYAMSKQIPIITSNIHHFENLPTVKINTPEEMASEIDKLFSNKENISQRIDAQNKYLVNNSWANVAETYANIITNNY